MIAPRCQVDPSGVIAEALSVDAVSRMLAMIATRNARAAARASEAFSPRLDSATALTRATLHLPSGARASRCVRLAPTCPCAELDRDGSRLDRDGPTSGAQGFSHPSWH